MATEFENAYQPYFNRLIPGQVITNPARVAGHLNYHGEQVRYHNTRYYVAPNSAVPGYCLLINNETGKVCKVKVNGVRIVEKQRGEHYGVDLITEVYGTTIASAGRFDWQNADLKKSIFKEALK